MSSPVIVTMWIDEGFQYYSKFCTAYLTMICARALLSRAVVGQTLHQLHVHWPASCHETAGRLHQPTDGKVC